MVFVRFMLFGMLLGLLSLMNLPGTGDLFATETKDVAKDVTAEAGEAAPKPYPPSENPMADVDAAIARAETSDKLAMIILGANWCHDSLALANHFKAPQMAALLDGRYETQLVNIGLFDHGADIIQRFGMPVIYGTPTVLIIDPATQRLVNADNMHQWRNAETISAEDTLAYFTMMADRGKQTPAAMPAPSAALAALYAQIDAFEAAQAQRIYNGYDVLRPMMAEGMDNLPDNFMDYWKQLAKLRYAVTGDLADLRAAARARVLAEEEDIKLAYPEYSKFSWE